MKTNTRNKPLLKIFSSIITIAIFAWIFIGSATQQKLPSRLVRIEDEQGVWRSIQVLDELDKSQEWNRVMDVLALKFDLEILDRESGYIRSTWKSYTYHYPQTLLAGGQTVTYRSRVIIKFIGDDWDVLKVKLESEFRDIPCYDQQLFNEVYTDIQGRVGRVVK